MSDQPEHLVLVHPRRLDMKMDRLIEDVADLKPRMAAVEQKIAKRHVDFAGQSERMDRIEQRLDRIERRLDVAGAADHG